MFVRVVAGRFVFVDTGIETKEAPLSSACGAELPSASATGGRVSKDALMVPICAMTGVTEVDPLAVYVVVRPRESTPVTVKTVTVSITTKNFPDKEVVEPVDTGVRKFMRP